MVMASIILLASQDRYAHRNTGSPLRQKGVNRGQTFRLHIKSRFHVALNKGLRNLSKVYRIDNSTTIQLPRSNDTIYIRNHH
jgi:hypothetical protein